MSTKSSITPVDTQAEELVISWLLDAGDEGRETVDRIVPQLSADHFTTPPLASAWSAIEALHNDGKAINTSSVAETIREFGCTTPEHKDLLDLMERNGERLFVAGIATDSTRRLVELRRWRQTLEVSRNLQYAWNAGGLSLDQALARASGDLEELQTKKLAAARRFDTAMMERALEIRESAGKPVRRTLTGFAPVDRLIGGFGDTDFVVLGAGTGHGKTALASQMMDAVARSGRHVFCASAEMNAWEHADRAFARAGKIRASFIRDNKLTMHELDQLVDIAKRDEWTRVHMLERDGTMTVQQVARIARMLSRKVHLGLVIVDYLQLLSVMGVHDERQSIAIVARTLKNLTLELNVPVLALTQFNRGVDLTQREPEPRDCYGSGEIEQAANVIVFLWRCQQDKENVIRLLCKKHRAGAANKNAELYWDPAHVRFHGGEGAQEALDYSGGRAA